MTQSSPVDAWKKHVLECGICRHAQNTFDVCPIGREFWRLPPPQPQAPVIAAPQPPQFTYVPPPVQPAYVPPQQPPAAPAPILPILGPGSGSATHAPPAPAPAILARPIPANMPNARFLTNIAQNVANKVLARSSNSDAAIAVPMEKTSKEISFSTAPGVMLNMPERDIEVYAEMKSTIKMLVILGEMVGKTIMVKEETKRVSKAENVELDEEQTAMIVAHIGGHFGARSLEDLHGAFQAAASQMMRMGDRLGNFMRVDDDTRMVMKKVRTLAIDMQSELERSYGGRLQLDDEMRAVVRRCRLVAMELQGEIDRRIGTP